MLSYFVLSVVVSYKINKANVKRYTLFFLLFELRVHLIC